MDDSNNPYAPPAPERAHGRGDLLSTDELDTSSAIVAEGVISEEDFSRAQRLHRRGLRVFGHVLIVLLVLFAGGGVRLLLDQASLVGAYLLLGAAIYLVCALLIFPRLSAAATWRTAFSLREPHRRLISPGLIQTVTPMANITLRWSNYASYRRSDELVLLYLKEYSRMFTIVPRHTFASDADWERFVAIVGENLIER